MRCFTTDTQNILEIQTTLDALTNRSHILYFYSRLPKRDIKPLDTNILGHVPS